MWTSSKDATWKSHTHDWTWDKVWWISPNKAQSVTGYLPKSQLAHKMTLMLQHWCWGLDVIQSNTSQLNSPGQGSLITQVQVHGISFVL